MLRAIWGRRSDPNDIETLEMRSAAAMLLITAESDSYQGMYLMSAPRTGFERKIAAKAELADDRWKFLPDGRPKLNFSVGTQIGLPTTPA